MTLLLCLTFSTTSLAKAIPIDKGQPAPFSGQLLDVESAIKLGQMAKGCDIRLDIELDRLSRLHQAEIDAIRPKWYEHPVFVVGVTVVAVVGLVGITAYGLNAVGQ